jgi:hypothetical protein
MWFRRPNLYVLSIWPTLSTTGLRLLPAEYSSFGTQSHSF